MVSIHSLVAFEQKQKQKQKKEQNNNQKNYLSQVTQNWTTDSGSKAIKPPKEESTIWDRDNSRKLDTQNNIKQRANLKPDELTGMEKELYQAIKNSQIEKVNLLLKQGIDLSNTGFPFLIMAVKQRNAIIVKSLLEANIQVNQQTSIGETAILTLFKKWTTKNWKKNKHKNNIAERKILDLLMQYKADITIADDQGHLPVLECEHSLHYGCIKIIEANADLNKKSGRGWTLLHYYASEGSDKNVKYLLKKGANPNLQDNYFRTPLHVSKSSKVTKLLLDGNANPNVRDREGDTPLHLASNAEQIKLLLANGANPNVRNRHGNTPLHWAKNLEKIELLIANGADPTIVNYRGFNAIETLASGESPIKHSYELNALKLLVSKFNYDINRPSSPIQKAMSLLQLASKHDRHQIVDYLIQKKASIHYRDKTGKQAIHYARHPEVLRALINAGADLNSRDSADNSVLISILKERTSEKDQIYNSVKILAQHKAISKQQNKEGKNALYYAVENNYYRVERLLVAHSLKYDRFSKSSLHNRGFTIKEKLKNDRSDKIEKAIYYIGLPLLYFGLSLYSREFAYAEHLSKNPLEGFNAYLSTVTASMTLGALFFSGFGSKRKTGEWFGNREIYGFFGGIGGFIIGSILYAKYKEKIKYSPFSYYAMPALSLTIPFFVYRF